MCEPAVWRSQCAEALASTAACALPIALVVRRQRWSGTWSSYRDRREFGHSVGTI
ncbi:hypothetical protein D9M72_343350 [compost metagenome]